MLSLKLQIIWVLKVCIELKNADYLGLKGVYWA